jgi:hypothetical protein
MQHNQLEAGNRMSFYPGASPPQHCNPTQKSRYDFVGMQLPERGKAVFRSTEVDIFATDAEVATVFPAGCRCAEIINYTFCYTF